MQTVEIAIAGQHLLLLPQKAVFWEEGQTLIIADAHFGKLHHFRKSGFALPLISSKDNYTRLEEAIAFCSAEKLLFLGDMFHSRKNLDWDTFILWRNRYPGLQISLTRGNHDLFSAEEYKTAGIHVYEEEWATEHFLFCHEFGQNQAASPYVIAGHVHPQVKFSGIGYQNLRLPGFIFGQHSALLPAFGAFTGGVTLFPEKNDRVYVIWEDKVLDVNS